MNKIFESYFERQKVFESSNSQYAQGIAWVEGQFVPLHEARIPLLDQGFLRGDLTYDVPAVWNGRYFRLDDHISRLQESCQKSRLRIPMSPTELKRILLDMVAKSGMRDAFVQVIVTRGLTAIRGQSPEHLINNLYLFAKPYVWIMSPEQQRTGASAVITQTVRRTPASSMDPTIKNLQWGDFTRAMLEATDRGAHFPLLTDEDMNLTEGSGYNLFVVRNGIVHTPDRGVLQGITRRTVVEVARAKNIEVRIEAVPIELAYHCNEMFICSTAGGIMPITSLDGRPIADGNVGPITKSVWDGYWEMHYQEQYNVEVPYDAGFVDGQS